jgi:hypothetical protein
MLDSVKERNARQEMAFHPYVFVSINSTTRCWTTRFNVKQIVLFLLPDKCTQNSDSDLEKCVPTAGSFQPVKTGVTSTRMPRA